MSPIILDLQYSLRLLRKKLPYSVVIFVSLLLGIGVNCGVFLVTNAALLRPLPIPNYSRLVRIFSANPSSGVPETKVSFLDFKDWQQETRTLEYVAAYASGGAFLTGDGPAERVAASGVTGDFFSVLGARALIGRTLVADDEKSAVAVISYALWERRYGGRMDVLGKMMHFNGRTAQLVGVMPPGINLPEGTDLWTVGVDTQSPRDSRGLSVIGCLRSGASLAGAQSEMTIIAARLADAYPKTNRDWKTTVVSLRELRTRSAKPALLLSLAGAVVLLLIACSNIGTIQLARIADRQQEISVRFALGATRLRVMRLLLLEMLVLSFGGAICGLLVMFWTVRLLLASGMIHLDFTPDIVVDARVVVFTLILLCGAAVLCSVASLRQAWSIRPGLALADSGRGATSGQRIKRLHALLVIGELGLVFVLLTTALLLKTSFSNVLHVDLGFEPQGVLTGRIAYFDDERRIQFFRRVVERVRGLPGVNDLALTYSLPLDNAGAYFRPAIIALQGRSVSESQVVASYHIISPGYFRVLRMTLANGRDFTEADGPQSQPVAIINESLARRVFSDEHVAGKEIACCDTGKVRTIVGVVHDLRSESPELKAAPEIYVPFEQDNQVSMRILVRTIEDPKNLIPEVRSAIASVDPQWPLYDIRSMEQVYDSTIAPRRSQLVLIGSFALLSLILSVIGIYGTFTYAAANRSREFAIRRVFGAEWKTIVRLILRDAGLLVAFGLALGVALSLLVWHVLRFVLFEIPGFGLDLYVEAAVLLAITALTCSIVPAMRAARNDPAQQLREL